MILRLRPACLLISQIHVPELEIELEIENYSVRGRPIRLQLACVPNRLRFV